MNDKQKIKQAIAEIKSGKKQKVTITLENPKRFHTTFFLKLWYRKLVNMVQRKITPAHFKNNILRSMGLTIRYDVCVPHNIHFDPYFPELITVGKGSIIGGCSTLLAHKLKGNKLTLGCVEIGERTLVGGLCIVEPGVKIGKNVLITSDSHVHTDVGDAEIWFGKPAKKVRTMDETELGKYFHESNGRTKEYYRDFYSKLKAFYKDPQQNYIKFQYHGNHLNAGMDWWRARNVFGILWSGLIVEATLSWNPSWFKNMMLRLAGAKIGKNVRIEKGVILDHLLTNQIVLEDDVILEEGVYLDAHEYTISQTVLGKTLIKKGARIKRESFARAGTTVGENSVVEAHSFFARTIPDNEVWGGQPAKVIKKKGSKSSGDVKDD